MKPTTILVADWSAPGYIAPFLPVFTIYRHPSDFPEHYVVRMFDMDKPTPYAMLADSEEAAVAKVPRGLVRLERLPADDANIVCVYV